MKAKYPPVLKYDEHCFPTKGCPRDGSGADFINVILKKMPYRRR
jgi:hypothetical protein